MNDSFYIIENWHMVYSYFKIIQNFFVLILIIQNDRYTLHSSGKVAARLLDRRTLWPRF